MRGRRSKPGAPARELQINPQDPEVQAAQDKAVTLVLHTLESEIQKRIKSGKGLDRMSLPDLLRELRDLIKASKKSTPAFMMAMAPSQAQIPVDRRQGRDEMLTDAVNRPVEHQNLLEAQEQLLQRKDRGEG